MAKLYERFVKVLQKWPVDPDSPTKAVAELIRDQGRIAFSKQGDFQGNLKECDKRLSSLERITKDYWSKHYPRSRSNGALDLTAEQCKFALCQEAQKSEDK